MTHGEESTQKGQIGAAVIEYFKSLREEIHLRVGEHTRLVWIKLVALGGAISFLMAKFYDTASPSLASPSLVGYLFWIIPVAAVVFDVLIAGNLRVINNLGYYIKYYLEARAFRGSSRKHLLHTAHPPKSGALAAALTTADGGKVPAGGWGGGPLKGLKDDLTKKGFHLVRAPTVRNTGKNKGVNEWTIIDVAGSYPPVGRRFSRFKGWVRLIFSRRRRESGYRQFLVKGKSDKLYVYAPKFGFWEEKAAQAAPEYRCYTWHDMGVIWCFTLAAWLFVLLLRWDVPKNVWAEVLFAVVSGILAVYALVKLIGSIRGERRF